MLGIDLSERVLERARDMTTEPGIRYIQADLETLELDDDSADLIYSSLAFHYLADFGRLVAMVRRALVEGGRFIFSIEHPIFMAPRQPEWSVDTNGRRIWPLDGYSVEGARTTEWFVEGVVKYHRTLGTTVNLLVANGFSITHLEEWRPNETQLLARPELAEEMDRPTFLLISAR